MTDITVTEAAAMVEQDKARRIEAAAAAVQAALREHNCDLLAVPQLTPDGRVVAVVQLVAR